MEIQDQLNRQRVKHIIGSYQLQGGDEEFWPYLDQLLQDYPSALVELAMTETLVAGWRTIPLVRGIQFLTQVHRQLQAWETGPIMSRLTPDQFQQITGLDGRFIFGTPHLSPPQFPARPV